MKHIFLSFFSITFALLIQGTQIPDLALLSLKEKIGQLFVVATVADPDNPVSQDCLFHRATREIPSIKLEQEVKELITKYAIGGIIYLGRSDAEKQVAMTDRLNTLNDALNKIPLLFALDAEWGPHMRIENAVKFPFNLTLGAIANKQLIETFGKTIGQMLKNLGIGLCLGPVCDCNTNPENPVINRRSFGQSPQQVTTCACYCAQGLAKAGVLSCAKHFPGHGDTAVDSHSGLPQLPHSKERLASCELVPFKAIIDDGIPTLMPGHLKVPALDDQNPATLSKKMMTDVLRTEYGFDGLIITDALDMQALTDHYDSAETPLRALMAGCDIILCPVDIPKAFKRIEQALDQSEITEQELNAHVQRILQAKQFIITHALKTLPTQSTIASVLNSAANKQLSNTLYQKAMTLVKNNHHISLEKGQPVVLIQLGTEQNTTFEEQLKAHHNCTVWRIRHDAQSTTFQNMLSSIHSDDTVVVGLFGLSYGKAPFGFTEQSLDCIKQLTEKNKNLTLVVFGNPYALKFIQDSPTILEAYEEHPYAQEAAASVLSGNLKPEGTLPISY